MLKGGLGNIMQQVQKFQGNMQEMQDALAKEEVTGESGGGMVKLIMTGKHEVRKVAIDDELMSDDKEMLEDLIAAAINDAAHKVEALSKDKMGDITGGLDLPEGIKLPF